MHLMSTVTFLWFDYPVFDVNCDGERSERIPLAGLMPEGHYRNTLYPSLTAALRCEEEFSKSLCDPTLLSRRVTAESRKCGAGCLFGNCFRTPTATEYTKLSKNCLTWIPAFAGMTNIFYSRSLAIAS